MKALAQLYLHVRLGDGAYLPAVRANNGRIRPNYAIHDGKAVCFPGSTYYLRFYREGKRVWEAAGHDSVLAQVTLERKIHALNGQALELYDPTRTPAPPSVIAPPLRRKRELTQCAKAYLAETEAHKPTKTLAAYQIAVKGFLKAARCVHIEDIKREDLLDYVTKLRSAGLAPRTIANRISRFG